MTSPIDMHVRLDGREDLSGQIYRQLRAAILERRLEAGDRLLPTRELAQRLEVSRNTVGLAYEWLTSEGLIAGRIGSGSFVEDVVRETHRRTSGAPIRQRNVWRGIAAPQPPVAPRYDFGVGAPDARLFPYATWRRLVARQLRERTLGTTYGDAAGHPRLREAVAHHAGVARGVQCSADDVVIANGAQQAFDLIARVLLEPGARVAVEEPGYPPPRQLFASYGAKVTSVRVDDEGLDVAALPDDTRLIYVTPSHQFPLGMPMSHARRIALLAWAERRNAVIVEDDYDSEFRFGGRPLDTLQSMDRSGRVLYVGSFSKVLLPVLRLGFVIAPPSLQAALQAASYVSGWHRAWPEQLALATMIEEGLLARHVRKMRREYALRHEHIIETLRARFADWVTPIASATGMHLCAPLRRSSLRVERELRERAAAMQVGFDPLSQYCAAKPARTGLVLGYGGIATNDLDEGLTRLRKCFAATWREK